MVVFCYCNDHELVSFLSISRVAFVFVKPYYVFSFE